MLSRFFAFIFSSKYCLWKTVFAVWSVPLHVVLAAEVVSYDFVANYDVLSPAGDKIGTYTTSVKGPENSIYTLTGEIELTFDVLRNFHQTYSSTDLVVYDSDGVKRYDIVEIAKGQRVQVTGIRSEDKTRLHFLEEGGRKNEKVVSREIMRSSYDYIMYEFRFPLPCVKQATLETKTLRILAPRTGRIETLRSESADGDGKIHATAYGDAKCGLIARDRKNKIIKESWFLDDGILLFEKTKNYQLKLNGIRYGNRN